MNDRATTSKRQPKPRKWRWSTRPQGPAGLINNLQAVPRAHQLAQRLAHRVKPAGHAAQVAHLLLSRRVGHRDVDAVLVNIQTNGECQICAWSDFWQIRNALTARRSGAWVWLGTPLTCYLRCCTGRTA